MTEKTEAANDTRFKPGNKFWMARASSGRNPIFRDKEHLWAMCCEYFQWVSDNPMLDEKVFNHQGRITRAVVAQERVMTLTSLCLFLHINDETWRDYRKRPDFVGVCEDAEKFIREQKFAGAASGRFNPMIIARDLGLRESAAIDHSSSDGSMSPKSVTPEMTPKEAYDAYLNSLNDEQSS